MLLPGVKEMNGPDVSSSGTSYRDIHRLIVTVCCSHKLLNFAPYMKETSLFWVVQTVWGRGWCNFLGGGGTIYMYISMCIYIYICVYVIMYVCVRRLPESQWCPLLRLLTRFCSEEGGAHIYGLTSNYKRTSGCSTLAFLGALSA